MKFTVKKEALRKELKFINKVAERKSTIPILATVKLDTTNDNLKMTATNLDVSIISTIEAEVAEKSKRTVNAFMLGKIVAFCGEDIEFELIDYRLIITSGKAKWQLQVFEETQYPETPFIVSPVLSIPGKLFRSMVKQTKFAITKEQSRFTLSGAKLILGKDKLTLVATDGHRLALAESKSIKTGEAELEGLIYFDAAVLIDALPKSETIGISDDNSHWYFQIDNRVIISRKRFGNFPNYEAVVPAHKFFTAKFDIIALTEALNQALIVADNHNIRWEFGDGIIYIRSRQEGSAFETSIVYSGDAKGIECGFNGFYLLEYCKTVASGICEVSLENGAMQTVFEVQSKDENERFRYVVMPLRI